MCKILGIYGYEEQADSIDLEVVARKAKRLKRYTAKDSILEAVDNVAFTQEELLELLNKGKRNIFLCGEQFEIPDSVEDVKFVGVNDPSIDIPENFIENKLQFEDISIKAEVFVKQAARMNEISDKIELWMKAAELGNAEAQYEIGVAYYNGTGVKQSYNKAYGWFVKSAKQDNMYAQYMLGNCYHYGYGTNTDFERAIKLYRKSANQGYHQAQYSVGDWYYRKLTIASPNEKVENALKWFYRAAEQGNAEAEYKIGYHLFKYGNLNEATKWLERAVEHGNQDAKTWLNIVIERRRQEALENMNFGNKPNEDSWDEVKEGWREVKEGLKESWWDLKNDIKDIFR